MIRFSFRISDGPEGNVQAAVVVQHQVQPAEAGPDARWQACVPVLEEETHRSQVPHDRGQVEGHQADQALRPAEALPAPQDRLQGLRRSVYLPSSNIY